jgi:hypothetical protein
VGNYSGGFSAECATSNGFVDINPDDSTRDIFEPANFGGGSTFDCALKMNRHGIKTS